MNVEVTGSGGSRIRHRSPVLLVTLVLMLVCEGRNAIQCDAPARNAKRFKENKDETKNSTEAKKRGASARVVWEKDLNERGVSPQEGERKHPKRLQHTKPKMCHQGGTRYATKEKKQQSNIPFSSKREILRFKKTNGEQISLLFIGSCSSRSLCSGGGATWPRAWRRSRRSRPRWSCWTCTRERCCAPTRR